MSDEKFIAGLKAFNAPSASFEEVAAVFNELPAMRHAPRYDAGSLYRLLPADGIGAVQSSGFGPIIVTPYSVGGGYLGQWSAEMEALQQSSAQVEEGASTAGLVYFDEGSTDKACFEETLVKLGIRKEDREYAAIYMTFDNGEELPEDDQGAEQPVYPYYLEQLKLICKAAIDRFPQQFRPWCVEQELTIGEALWSFFQFEKSRFNPTNALFPPELDGIIGGDGDFEREELAFGMIVEDRQAGVYRIWTRAALCTK